MSFYTADYQTLLLVWHTAGCTSGAARPSNDMCRMATTVEVGRSSLLRSCGPDQKERMMWTGFKASNWRWNRNADIRDKIDRLDINFKAATDEDRELLARVRQVVSDAVRLDKRVTDIQITIVDR